LSRLVASQLLAVILGRSPPTVVAQIDAPTHWCHPSTDTHDVTQVPRRVRVWRLCRPLESGITVSEFVAVGRC
jgi:hypothetical protein